MKPHHLPIETIRVCDLQLGDKVKLTGKEFRVTAIDDNKITCRQEGQSFRPQYFNRGSQQKVELVKSKSNDKETEKANRLSISENGKVRH